MMLIDELVLENTKPRWLYFAVSFVTLLFMYWLLDRSMKTYIIVLIKKVRI